MLQILKNPYMCSPGSEIYVLLHENWKFYADSSKVWDKNWSVGELWVSDSNLLVSTDLVI